MLRSRRDAARLPAPVDIAARRRAGQGPDRVIHVGRMPRTDAFRIGVEVVPRPREDPQGRAPRPPAG